MSLKEDALINPITSQALLKSRINSPNFTHSKGEMKAESLPRYSTFTYQFQTVNKPKTQKNDFSSRFVSIDVNQQKHALNLDSRLKRVDPYSETFLKFFILKTQHLKGQ